MDNNAIWYVDGRWVHPDEATISINDIAVLRGYSVFESLRTYNRNPFHLDEHLLRLYRSAVLIGIAIPWSSEQVKDIVRDIIARNVYPLASIPLLVTAGVREQAVLPSDTPTFIAMITQL